jgi:hypothetical protein
VGGIRQFDGMLGEEPPDVSVLAHFDEEAQPPS